jgi:hypothetical protein
LLLKRALRALLKKPNASEKLSEFVRSASVAGQLYALLGLRLCDRPAFERAVPDFLRRDGIVTTMTGCIIYDEPVAAIARRSRKATTIRQCSAHRDDTSNV